MACCAVLALVIGAVRTIWFRVFPGRRPAEPGFAPPARRLADGTALPTPAPGSAPAQRPPASSGLLIGVVAGTAAYVVVVAALAASPLVRTLDGPWLGRDVGLVTLAAAALIGALITNTGAHRPALLLAAGITWTELGLLDMHVLGLFDFRVAPLPLDLLFHGGGLVAVALGARHLTPARPRPVPRLT